MEMEARHITRGFIWNGVAVEVFFDPIPCGIPVYHVTVLVASEIYIGLLSQWASGVWHYEPNADGDLERQFELKLLSLFHSTGAVNIVFDIEAEDD